MSVVFFSYAHADEAYRDRIEVSLAMLKRQGLIETWHDRRIMPGEDFADAIDANLERADVILLLVSPDFLNSDYCYEKEMRRALERDAEDREGRPNHRPALLVARGPVRAAPGPPEGWQAHQ